MPQTFATPASLYEEQAAALANGESSYFGPTVIVAGVTWTWNGNYYYETAPGSPSNPFADISELEEHFTANPPQYLGQYAFVDNGANPPKPYRWHGGAPTNWVEEAGGGAPAAVDWVDLT